MSGRFCGGSSSSSKAVIVNGKYFSAIVTAAKELDKPASTLSGWIRMGKEGYSYYEEEE